MPGTPEHERPCRAVPQSADQHDQHEVEIRPGPALAVPSERYVEVVPKPGGKADVPASPELGDARGKVRRAEVLGGLHTHQRAQTDCHVRVSREVEVDLDHVGGGTEPGLRCRGPRQGKGGIRQRRHGVRDEDLLAEAQREPQGPGGKALQGRPRRCQLRAKVAEPRDGSRGDLREKRKVNGQIQDTLGRARRAAIEVYEVAHRLERVKRDADRQDNAHRGQGAAAKSPEESVQALNPEVRVLEVGQERQVDGHSEGHPDPRSRGELQDPSPVDPLAHQPGDERGTDQKGEEVQAPPCVEKPACHEDPGPTRHGRKQVVDRQEDREKQKQEQPAGKGHGGLLDLDFRLG